MAKREGRRRDGIRDEREVWGGTGAGEWTEVHLGLKSKDERENLNTNDR